MILRPILKEKFEKISPIPNASPIIQEMNLTRFRISHSAGWAMALVLGTTVTSAAPPSLSGDRIQAAQAYSRTHGGLALLVWEDGVLRHESYHNGHSATAPLHIYSGTKSFFGVLAAIASQEGLLDLDERVTRTIPEWRLRRFKRDVTIRHLLDFTSGLDSGFREIYGGIPPDKLKAAVQLPSGRKAGTVFVYGPGHLQVFGEVLNRKLASRGLTYERYLRDRLLDPLGIQPSKWREDGAGNVHLSAGMHLTARQWLKFGVLLAQNGDWEGKSLVDRGALAACYAGTPVNPAYGLTFWVNRHAADPAAREVDVETWLDKEPLPEDWSHACLSKAAPADLVCSLGSNGQRLYVVPSAGLVIVHQGKAGKFQDAAFLGKLFGSGKGPGS